MSKVLKRSRIDPYVEQIRKWTEDGWRTNRIAKELGCSGVLVQQVMRREGIARHKGSPLKGTKIDRPSSLDPYIDQIRELTKKGWRMGKIAKELGCKKGTLWNAMKKHGVPRHPKHSCPGEHNPAWKGGRYYDDDGYVLIYAPDHPYATKDGRVREHRLVVEGILGRYLLPDEVVDHKDGVKNNNDPLNLRVFDKNGDHLRETLTGRMPNWSEEGKKRIVGRPRSSNQQHESIRKESKNDVRELP